MISNAEIAAIIATLISLFVEWFPGVRDAWERLTAAQKQGVMAFLVAVVSVAAVIVQCSRGGQCPADWLAFLMQVLIAFITAAAANQAVHMLTKKRTAAA